MTEIFALVQSIFDGVAGLVGAGFNGVSGLVGAGFDGVQNFLDTLQSSSS
ncbi:hypothetical protein SFC07_10435 [Corynebacterium callunae]